MAALFTGAKSAGKDLMAINGAKTIARVLICTLGLCTPFPLLAKDAVGDPFERVNRKIFAFNESADKYLLRPLAVSYRFILPDQVESAVGRVFANLGEIVNVSNDLLQGKWGQAGHDSGRFLINTTLGAAGIFDVAKSFGLERKEDEDFGQTLARWGVGSGAYIILPFIGPSTLRDAPAAYVDSLLNPIGYIEHVPTRNTVYGVNALSIRADLIKSEQLLSGDKYLFIRDIYLQRRQHLILDGQVEDDFGDFDDYGDY